jgi:hypothetical protein
MGFLCVISLLCTYLLTETYQTDVDDVEAEQRRVAAEGGGSAATS